MDLTTPEQWTALLHQWERSGQTVKAFAERHGVNVSTFYAWRKRLAPSAPSTTLALVAPRFVELQATAAAPAARSRAPFELLLRNGRLLRIPVEFDEGALAKLLVVVEGGA